MALLEVSGLYKSFPDGERPLRVLEDVSFEVFSGDVVGVWGERRSGKSTLLRIIAGHEPPDRGVVRFDGIDITALTTDRRARALRNDVAFASFGDGQARGRTPLEHVWLAARADGRTTGRRARSMTRAALNLTDVLGCAEHRYERLSLDERIRVELARALVRKPRLLLVDDPPRLQSPSDEQSLDRLLISLGKQANCAVLVSSCDLGLVARADRHMALGSGSLRVMDTPATVLPFPGRLAG
ncbi:MAG: ATP-binding cassette domain-containing protein [Solirubrobacteraceae bacterium]